MLISRNGYRRDKHGQWVKKPVSDLNNSRHYVLVRCDECDKLYKTLWNNRQHRLEQGKIDLCNPCSKSGVRNSQHGKDRSELLAHARTFYRNNSMLGKHHSASSRAIMSKSKASQIASGEFNILANNRGRKAWYESTKSQITFFVDSALELLRMKQLDGDPAVRSWTKRHGIKIPYEFQGVQRYCVPDFLITLNNGTRCIEEVKGRVTSREMAKKEAMSRWCQREGYAFRYLLQSELNENGEYRRFLKGL